MSFKFLEKLSQDFTALLNDKEDYNVIIEVSKDENKESFTAHSAVLRYRSSYFNKELTNIPQNENNVKTIYKPDISAESFNIALRYIYNGIVDLVNVVETKFIFELMILAGELELEELFNKVEIYLIENKDSWLLAHFSLIYHTIFKQNNKFKLLEKFCNNIIAKHPNIIFDAEDFNSLPESTLISTIKRDDLKLEEIKIWDKVIQWGINRNPKLPSKLEEWNNEDFMALKTTLQNCLPYIRYFQISRVDIFKKIKPYMEIFNKQLSDDLLYHLLFPDKPVKSIILPPRSISIPEIPEPLLPQIQEKFSTIITNEHATEISSWIWINRNYTPYSPYRFKLILRGSKDGFDPKIFWKMCHDNSNTVIILKVAGTNEILGGFNPLKWDKTMKENTWMKTKDSFIFSLKNGELQNSILSRVKNEEKAIQYYGSANQTYNGIRFGNDELLMQTFVSNFTLDKESWCNFDKGFDKCYEKRIRKTEGFFSIVDYEVFKVFIN
ncbi:hypothetical protein Glove_269g52 [Diversispora epigaea]|uniref:BTB domain-containing protein n=1 Tax=Diversispora epigaea TaxID=1348612 RepID=A0A397IB48_9GLOM|nr:hypothetical protein Glove_269g52 [Diversispora epigaea]